MLSFGTVSSSYMRRAEDEYVCYRASSHGQYAYYSRYCSLQSSNNNKISLDTQHIRALLALSKTLKLLDLRNNKIMDSGLFHLCDGLKNPSCQLETLCLWNNQITAVAMAPLTEALLENKTLSMLNLGQNAIMDQGTASRFHHFFFIGRSKRSREKVRVR